MVVAMLIELLLYSIKPKDSKCALVVLVESWTLEAGRLVPCAYVYELVIQRGLSGGWAKDVGRTSPSRACLLN